MSASTAIHSDAVPSIVNTKKIAFTPSAMVMFCHKTCDVCCEMRIVSATLRGSSSMSAISAVSIAVSVPAAPIAIPSAALASAGASLTPSPIMAT